jgi:zona occludens toxin (predicted ATPase)
LVDKKMKENFHRIYSYYTTDSTENMKRGRSLWKNSHDPLVALLLLVCFSTVYHKHDRSGPRYLRLDIKKLKRLVL